MRMKVGNAVALFDGFDRDQFVGGNGEELAYAIDSAAPDIGFLG